MRRLFAFLVAGTLLTALPTVAQETIRVGEVDAVRVVIAPPQTELARIVKQGLLTNYRSANPDSRAYAEAQKLYFFYGSRHFEPIWLSEGEACEIGFRAEDAYDGLATFAREVRQAFGDRRIDAAVIPDEHRRKKLLVADMESTISEQEGLAASLQAVWDAPDAAAALREWAGHLARFHPRILAVARAIQRVRRSDPAKRCTARPAHAAAYRDRRRRDHVPHASRHRPA